MKEQHRHRGIATTRPAPLREGGNAECVKPGASNMGRETPEPIGYFNGQGFQWAQHQTTWVIFYAMFDCQRVCFLMV